MRRLFFYLLLPVILFGCGVHDQKTGDMIKALLVVVMLIGLVIWKDKKVEDKD